MKALEKNFENSLWSCRFLVLLAVLGSMLIAVVMFGISSVEAIALITGLKDLLVPGEFDDTLNATVTCAIQVIDGYLLGTIMLIFSFGLYELFISKIDVAEKDPNASRVLLIHSLDDLKDRLAKVILLILVVKYFEQAVKHQSSFQSPMHLLLLAAGILLIAAALYLTHAQAKHGELAQNHPTQGKVDGP